MHLQAGTLLQGGKYKIEKVLGQGGFGLTYLATQVGLNRKVAIKEFFMREYCNRDADTSQVTIGSEGSRDVVDKFRAKFVKEAQNIACLKHPHIISIHDVFEENGTAYYVMEYLDRGSLAELVKQRGRLSEADALRYIRQIADALRYIHARNMNHLDVKPGNILIDETDGAVLIDFGLSKRYDDEGNQTSTTPVGISHGYAPLEQYKKGGVGTFSPSTDIYSLGATLYKLITGDTPPDANDVNDEGLPAFPSYVLPSVASAIEQAMQPRRKDRPQSIEAFLALLDVPATPVAKEEVREDEETVVIEEAPSISSRRGRTPNIAEKRFSPTKLLWPLLICIVAIVAFFGVRAYSNHRAEVARLAAIEQQRLDSIAQAEEIARLVQLEQQRKDSIAKVENAARLAQLRKDSVETATKRAAERRKNEQLLLSYTGMVNGHKYVDLGLSVKWATCNVGASSPNDYGDYYAWGETNAKNDYSWSTYKLSNGRCNRLVKYNKDSEFGIVDDKTTLEFKDDAARVNWGGTWRMPTLNEVKELNEKCSWTWITLNGVKGCRITGPNGNCIFLPAAGEHHQDEKVARGHGVNGVYWSSTLSTHRDDDACYLYVCHDGCGWTYYGRYVGRSVRPVTE